MKNKVLLAAINCEDTLSTYSNNIVIGSATSGISLPSDDSEQSYEIETVNNTVHIVSESAEGYALATKKFLNYVMGYDYYGRDTYYIGDGVSPSTLTIPTIDLSGHPNIDYRQCDWNDVYNGCDGLGYTCGTGDENIADKLENAHKTLNWYDPYA